MPPKGVRRCKRLGPKCRILRALYKGITVAPLPCRYGAPGPEVCASKNTHVYIGLDPSWWLGSDCRRFQFRELQRRIKVLACDARHQYIELHACSFISSLLRVKKTETCALNLTVCYDCVGHQAWQLARIQETSKLEGKTLVI
jgi:hypothetical protein